MSLGFIVSLINPAINATSAICCSVIADGAAIHVKSNIIIIRSIRYLGICTASHQTYTAAKGAAFTATHSGNILRNLSSVHNECAIFINSNTAPQGIAVARAICSACDFGVICIKDSVFLKPLILQGVSPAQCSDFMYFPLFLPLRAETRESFFMPRRPPCPAALRKYASLPL